MKASCDLFGQPPSDIEEVKNKKEEVLKAVGNNFIYYNRELIFESKNELLIEELKELED
ncbi:hypothetical protein [Salinicola halophilus]|uniref:hypothetical protein n=1 Tax=Salinicola halophilus TaxID=184065 RepID=UPI0013A6873A|nr:hypothetical protein [Salinicola halophilus]